MRKCVPRWHETRCADIGSNSAQLQIVDVTAGGPPLPAQAVKEPTLLGDDAARWAIGPAGIERIYEAVAGGIRIAEPQGIDELYVFVTSAVRDAANRDPILDRIEILAGVRPQHLSGDEEARLTYLTVHGWYGWSAGRLLLIDIGGGSMEIVLGRDAEPQLSISLHLGAGRLTRAFLPDDPPSRGQLKAMRRHIREALSETPTGSAGRAIRAEWWPYPKPSNSSRGCRVRRPSARARSSVAGWRAATCRDGFRSLRRSRGQTGAAARCVRPSRTTILAGAVVADLTMATLDIGSVEICP
jgi:exopolyphosphatase/guanosine-5'-triphosphate,3'-diphosphate pyrophosphatase